jgi:hypothetical protein
MALVGGVFYLGYTGPQQKPKATKQIMLCGSGVIFLELPSAWSAGRKNEKELREMYFTVFSLGSKLPLGLCWASSPMPLVSTPSKKQTGVAARAARICSRSARLHSTSNFTALRGLVSGLARLGESKKDQRVIHGLFYTTLSRLPFFGLARCCRFCLLSLENWSRLAVSGAWVLGGGVG